MASPSPGYSITLRVQSPITPHATGDLTTAIGKAGGVVTALDVVESHYDWIVVDVSVNTSDGPHADAITEAVTDLDGFEVRKVCDRTFLMHLGGKIEVAPKVPLRTPRRPVPRLHPRRGPGLPGDRREPGGRPPADHQAQHRRRGHRRLGGARARQHRPGGGAAGDGGQGGAVQAVRRRRRLAGLPGHPGHRRDRRRSSRRSRPVYGGINLEDIAAPRCFEIEAPAARAARHPGLPRRPARHRDRRARRADQRAARGRQAARRRPDRGLRRRRGRARRSSGCCSRRAPATSSAATRSGAVPRRASGPRPVTDAGSPRTPTRPASPARCTTRWPAPTSSSASRAPNLLDAATTSRRWPTGAIVFALANPDPEVDPVAARASTPRSSPPGAATSRTRSTTCSPSPGFFRGLLDAGRHRHHRRHAARRGDRDRRRGAGRPAQPELHRAERLRPRRGARRRGGGACRRPWPLTPPCGRTSRHGSD